MFAGHFLPMLIGHSCEKRSSCPHTFLIILRRRRSWFMAKRNTGLGGETMSVAMVSAMVIGGSVPN